MDKENGTYIFSGILFSLKKKEILLKDLFMRDTHTHTQRHRHRQREKQASCREPDAGLDPRSPGSHPRPQVAPNCCATWAALHVCFLRMQKRKLRICVGETDVNK